MCLGPFKQHKWQNYWQNHAKIFNRTKYITYICYLSVLKPTVQKVYSIKLYSYLIATSPKNRINLIHEEIRYNRRQSVSLTSDGTNKKTWDSCLCLQNNKRNIKKMISYELEVWDVIYISSKCYGAFIPGLLTVKLFQAHHCQQRTAGINGKEIELFCQI